MLPRAFERIRNVSLKVTFCTGLRGDPTLEKIGSHKRVLEQKVQKILLQSRNLIQKKKHGAGITSVYIYESLLHVNLHAELKADRKLYMLRFHTMENPTTATHARNLTASKAHPNVWPDRKCKRGESYPSKPGGIKSTENQNPQNLYRRFLRG